MQDRLEGASDRRARLPQALPHHLTRNTRIKRGLTLQRFDRKTRSEEMKALGLQSMLVIFGGFMAAIGHAGALSERSPFLPGGVSGTPGIAASPDALEFRGVMSGPSGSLFYLYDPVKKQGVWAGPNETENPFTIVAADANGDDLEVRMNDGRRLHLKLLEAKIQAGGINTVTAPMVNVVAGAGPDPARLTEVQAAWREEFNRRLAENSASH